MQNAKKGAVLFFPRHFIISLEMSFNKRKDTISSQSNLCPFAEKGALIGSKTNL